MIKTLDARDRAFELVESGATTPMDLLMACLQYMSTDEVQDMLDYNGYEDEAYV